MTQLIWGTPESPGAEFPLYDVVRSPVADDFSDAVCLGTSVGGNAFFDTDPVDAAFYYLVRAKNACGAAMAGASDDTPRIVTTCP